MKTLESFYSETLNRIAKTRKRSLWCGGGLWVFAFVLCISCFNHSHSFGLWDIAVILIGNICLFAGAGLFSRNQEE